MKFTANLLLFSGLWLVVTDAQVDSWIVGAPIVTGAAVTATYWRPTSNWRWNAVGILHFVPIFIRESFVGGLDIAWRSCHPRLPIDPRLIEYKLRVCNGTSRVFFMNVVSLLPGTFVADISGDALIVHVIDRRQPIQPALAKLEGAVAKMFAIPLEINQGQGDQLS